MAIAVSLGWMVVAVFLEGVTGFPDQHHVVENPSQANNNVIRVFEDAVDEASTGNRSPRIACSLPKKEGICEALIPSYYYNGDRRQCLSFNYGGCGGNANRFPTLVECENICGHLASVCHHGSNNETYNPDTIILNLPAICTVVHCNHIGEIEYTTPLGSSSDCCECHGKLYGGGSATCQYVEHNGICQEGCDWDGNTVGNGELLQSIPSRCSKKWCLNSNILEIPIFHSMTGCCLDAKGRMKENGAVDNDGCLQKICTEGVWELNPININAECKICSVRNDPHFTDFSGVTFDWHVGCNHALLQEDKPSATFGVFMDFNRVGAIGYVGGPTTYQEDIDTKVVLTPGSFHLTVNGHANLVNSVIPELLVGPNGQTTTVYAWKTPSCVRLYGVQKIMVELCGSSITIWASPWSLGEMKLAGLCGSTTNSALAKKTLRARNGDEYTLTNNYAYLDAPDSFGITWQVMEQTKDTCPALTSRSMAANEDTRKACMNGIDSSNTATCLKVVDNAGLIGDDLDNIFKNCLFDLCIAVTDPEAPFTLEEMLEQTKEIAAQVKSHVESTIEFASVRVICPFGWSPVGGQCYKIHTFNASLSLEDAQNNCNADEAILAHPHDVTEINKFIKGSYWLGALHVDGDGDTEWIMGGGKIPENQFLIGVQHQEPNNPFLIGVSRDNSDKPNICLEIQLPTTDSNTKPQVIVKQNVEINANAVKNVKINTKVYYYNANNEIIKIEGTNSHMECIQPEVYICEREPLACGDEDDNCGWRAADGECNASKAYMYNTCKESCKVPCECDQPDTCTEVGGMCQPLNAICNDTSDATLCSNGDCTCCYFPDPCQDFGEEDCEAHKSAGLCEDIDAKADLEKYCNRTCGFCNPIF